MGGPNRLVGGPWPPQAPMVATALDYSTSFLHMHYLLICRLSHLALQLVLLSEKCCFRSNKMLQHNLRPARDYILYTQMSDNASLRIRPTWQYLVYCLLLFFCVQYVRYTQNFDRLKNANPDSNTKIINNVSY